ncbi:hypothetical protein DIPPA_19616 [Diplonema papillatum]|nr:hypothetical protein DIPPA_19616 [Diplonema papillatum]
MRRRTRSPLKLPSLPGAAGADGPASAGLRPAAASPSNEGRACSPQPPPRASRMMKIMSRGLVEAVQSLADVDYAMNGVASDPVQYLFDAADCEALSPGGASGESQATAATQPHPVLSPAGATTGITTRYLTRQKQSERLFLDHVRARAGLPPRRNPRHLEPLVCCPDAAAASPVASKSRGPVLRTARLRRDVQQDVVGSLPTKAEIRALLVPDAEREAAERRRRWLAAVAAFGLFAAVRGPLALARENRRRAAVLAAARAKVLRAARRLKLSCLVRRNAFLARWVRQQKAASLRRRADVVLGFLRSERHWNPLRHAVARHRKRRKLLSRALLSHHYLRTRQIDAAMRMCLRMHEEDADGKEWDCPADEATGELLATDVVARIQAEGTRLFSIFSGRAAAKPAEEKLFFEVKKKTTEPNSTNYSNNYKGSYNNGLPASHPLHPVPLPHLRRRFRDRLVFEHYSYADALGRFREMEDLSSSTLSVSLASPPLSPRSPSGGRPRRKRQWGAPYLAAYLKPDVVRRIAASSVEFFRGLPAAEARGRLDVGSAEEAERQSVEARLRVLRQSAAGSRAVHPGRQQQQQQQAPTRQQAGRVPSRWRDVPSVAYGT